MLGTMSCLVTLGVALMLLNSGRMFAGGEQRRQRSERGCTWRGSHELERGLRYWRCELGSRRRFNAGRGQRWNERRWPSG